MVERMSIAYGAHLISATIIRRDRKTLEIAVNPDGSVLVKAPLLARNDAIEAKVRKRGAWVIRQQSYFSQYMPRTPARRYLSGETHLYLGRQYRLNVKRGSKSNVKMFRGELLVQSEYPDNADITRELISAWYRSKALEKFPERLEICLKFFRDAECVRPKALIIRNLRLRWGSMSPSGRLMLNSRLIEAPIAAIDYVIMHELCHMRVPNHGKKFYNLLERVLPDWQIRKDRLERLLA